jgi:hypothetical protein
VNRTGDVAAIRITDDGGEDIEFQSGATAGEVVNTRGLYDPHCHKKPAHASARSSTPQI